MRIAYLSPLPPETTGIADYSAELAPALAQLSDVTLYSRRRPEPDFGLPWRSINDFRASEEVALYHIGNSLFHEEIYRTALVYPGACVLHDPTLHHFISAITECRGDYAGYLREMVYSHGSDGGTACRNVLHGKGSVSAEAFPLTGRLLDFSQAIIVHSEDAARRVRNTRPVSEPAVIPHVVAPQPRLDRAVVKQQLGFSPSMFLLGSFGLATAEKRIPSVLAALERLDPVLPEWRYVIVGEDSGVVRDALSDHLGIADRVEVLGRTDWDTFGRYLAAVDVAVNLRQPTRGESSGATLRALGHGTPVIVSDAGAFRELPADAVLFVPTGDSEIAGLVEALGRIAADPEDRQVRGEAGRSWVNKNLNPDRIARQFLEVLERTNG